MYHNNMYHRTTNLLELLSSMLHWSMCLSSTLFSQYPSIRVTGVSQHAWVLCGHEESKFRKAFQFLFDLCIYKT